METVFYILAKVVELYLSIVSVAMFLRVILQFFASEDSKILAMCCMVSEPVIYPFRVIMTKLNVGQDSPLDIPFFIAYLSLTVIQMFLPII